MKTLIFLITTVSILLVSCDFKPPPQLDHGVMSFRLDSSGVDKGYHTLELFNAANKSISATNGVDDSARLFDLRFTHLDNSFEGKGVYSQENDLLDIRFIFFDISDIDRRSYYFELVDSLKLEYTKIGKEWIEGEFYLKVRSDEDSIDENAVYTLTEGKFEFTDYDHRF